MNKAWGTWRKIFIDNTNSCYKWLRRIPKYHIMRWHFLYLTSGWLPIAKPTQYNKHAEKPKYGFSTTSTTIHSQLTDNSQHRPMPKGRSFSYIHTTTYFSQPVRFPCIFFHQIRVVFMGILWSIRWCVCKTNADTKLYFLRFRYLETVSER